MTEQLGPLALAQASLTALTVYKNLDGRPPNDFERSALEGWTGWGPLAKTVDPYQKHHLTGGMKEISEALEEILSPQEEQAAKEATATSFYTTPLLASALWRLLAGLGFDGGRVLEPGCGSGHVIAAAPTNLRPRLDVTGVEIDPTSAGIAALLHPQATIINKPLERAAFRIGAFDAAIGNVPFSDAAIYDATWPDDEAGFKPSLHWYFLWRALKALHPGGIAALITSRYTMDGASPRKRAFISRLGEFVGAIRLPSGAFSRLGFGGVADILVMRRRPYTDYDAEQVELGAWATAREDTDLRTSTNDYWWSHPEMCLGAMEPTGGVANGATLKVTPPDGADVTELLNHAIDQLIHRAVHYGQTWQAAEHITDDTAVTVADEKEGSFHLAADGQVTQVLNGNHEPISKPKDELKHLIVLRDAALELFAADADLDRADSDIEPLRTHTRKLYEQYVDRYGPLNRSTITYGPADEETGFPTINRRTPPMGGFRGVGDRPGDPDYPTVLALGVMDEEMGGERPAEILLRRVNKRAERKRRADNPAEALALCWDELGRIDLPRIAELLTVPEAEVPNHLDGLAYCDPADGRWVPAEEYLSGNVREKLRQAQTLADGDERWLANAAALTQVQPVDLGPSDILARLGAPWIPADVVKSFIVALFGLSTGRYDNEANSVKVRHEPLTAAWEVSAPVARHKPTATTQWGTDRFNAVDLIEKALNGTVPVAYDEIEVPDDKRPGKTRTKRVKNMADTQLAEERTKAIQEMFGTWVWADPDRTERLCRLYNDAYNAVRLRKYDGSMWTFPGMRAGFDPYEHQRSMVARIVASDSTICAHSVGAGKTSIMFMAALTMKRLGLVNKPCIVVPNHLLEQVVAEGRRLYPSARILMVTKQDLNPKRRKYFAAKVAAADWDAVVMTVQQFGSIPVSPHLEAEHLATQIELLEEAIGSDAELDGSRTVKRLAKQVIKLKQRHAMLTDFGGQLREAFPETQIDPSLADAEAEELRTARKRRGRDDGLYFDHLGIDFLMIDEFHYFKNLMTPCRTEGFSLPASKRAEDAFMKINWLREMYGRCFAGFTGTPISNTLAEAYTLLRYTQSAEWLRDKGLYSFDAFAGMFIVFEWKIEVSPDGSGFRLHRRPSEFANVPELRLMLGETMDVRTRHQLKLDGPARVIRDIVEVEPQPELKPFTEHLVERADKIRDGKPLMRWSETKDEPVEDNMLSVCNDGRKAALWLPLVGLDSAEPGKPDVVAANVARIYHATKDWIWPDLAAGTLFGDGLPGAFQMVFCDLGTPRDGDGQVYGEIRDLLVAHGVPRDMIRFIHDAKSDLERAELFRQCRSGEVAVLLVSTEKGGTGVNAQDRMVAIHHVDAPWRPADVEQRDGRGDRPGNMSEVLYIYRYVTKGSFDSYMWQGLERKSFFIFQILSGELDARQVKDLVSFDTIDYGMIKAAATGQELVLDLENAKAEVARLRNLQAAHLRDASRLRRDQADYREWERKARDEVKALQAIATLATEAERTYARRWITEAITDEQQVAELLAEVGRHARATREEKIAGTWRGVEVKFAVTWYAGAPHLSVYLSGRYTGWASVAGATPKLLKKGNELALLAFIDKAIDSAQLAADEAARRADVFKEKAEAIAPEIGKKFEHEEALKQALAERARLEELIAADLEAPAEMAQAA